MTTEHAVYEDKLPDRKSKFTSTSSLLSLIGSDRSESERQGVASSATHATALGYGGSNHDDDAALARHLQALESTTTKSGAGTTTTTNKEHYDNDEALARRLQAEFDAQAESQPQQRAGLES